jgi:hypothetical protein
MTIHAKALGVLRVTGHITISNDRILRTEEMETPFGTLEVLVRRYDLDVLTESRTLGKKREKKEHEEYTQWIIPGRGLVREEKRSDDGSLRVRELIDFRTP